MIVSSYKTTASAFHKFDHKYNLKNAQNFNHDVLTSKDTHQNHSSFQFLSGNDTLLKNDIQRKDSKESVHQLSQWIDDTMAPTSALNASDAGLQPLYHKNDKIGGGGKASSMMAEKVDKIDLLDSYL